ncbi:hypothetical protein PIPA1_38430 [Pelosinus sp. IPA-1]|nr:hypothetical protein PIPA1_38430 [Pelosinus sp. IPA-1]
MTLTKIKKIMSMGTIIFKIFLRVGATASFFAKILGFINQTIRTKKHNEYKNVNKVLILITS